MGLIATMASPIAWEHHCGVMLPIFTVAFASLALALWLLVGALAVQCARSARGRGVREP